MHKIFSKYITIAYLPLLVLTLPSIAKAELKLNGFADLVASKSNRGLTLFSIRNTGQRLSTDPDTRVGINMSSELSDSWGLASQFLTRGESGGSYNMQADWLFLTYRPIDPVSVRIGRQINPNFLYAEQIDVGYTYLWIRTPIELYSLDPVKQFNGVSAAYTHTFGSKQLTAAIYGGSGDFNVTNSAGSFAGSFRDAKGAYIDFSSDNFRLRGSYIALNPLVKASLLQPIAGNALGLQGTLVAPVSLGSMRIVSLGASMDYKNIVAISEIGRNSADGTGVHSMNGAYGTLGYHLCNERLTPHFTYARLYNLNTSIYNYPDPNTNILTNNHSMLTYESSTIFGAMFRVNHSISAKLEYLKTKEIFIDPTVGFSADTISASLDTVF